jgi:hypothetical protein
VEKEKKDRLRKKILNKSLLLKGYYKDLIAFLSRKYLKHLFDIEVKKTVLIIFVGRFSTGWSE